MYSLSDIAFWFSLIAILISFLVAFYIPGRVILGEKAIKQEGALHVFSIVVGIAMFAWQGYLFGILQLRWLTYLYIAVFVGLYIYKRYYSNIKISLSSFRKIDPLILVIGFFGIGAQILPYLQMGLKTQQGITLINNNLGDHIWHGGLIAELVDHFPPSEPGMAGIILKDYHYWFSLVTAELIRVFNLPELLTQFLGMYLLASVLLLFVGYYFAKLIYNNKVFIRLFLFLVFFSGDISIWFLLISQQTFDINVLSLINNGTKFVDSPAFAYSILIGLTAFYFLFQAKERLSKKMIIVVALLFGSLLEFKVYTGITFMFGLCALACYSLLKKRLDTVAVFVLASLFGAAVFFPNNSSSGGLFFLPFEIPRDFITQKVLGFHDWELRWRIYLDHENYLRIIQYGLYMSGVYLFIQYGLQLVGIIPLKRVLKQLSFERYIAMCGILISGTILGLFFYQKVGGANIWEFFLPVGIMLSFLSALTLSYLINSRVKVVSILIVVLIIVIVTPRWIVTVRNQFTSEYLSGFHGVTHEEYASYSYLKDNVSKNEVVLIVNHPSHIEYVSFIKVLSGTQLYLSGEGVRQQETPEVLRRRDIVESIRNEKDVDKFAILKKEKIKYLYFYGEAPRELMEHKNARVVFQNKKATIIRFDI